MLSNYLLYLNKIKSKKSSGFTLVELLTVIVIISVLSAIAIPSILGQSAKAKQTEAKVTIGSVNKAQIAFRTENNTFAKDMDSLGIGLPTETTNYSYAIKGDENTTTIAATAKDTSLRSYSGGSLMFLGKNNNAAITSTICENKVAGTTPATPPILQTGANTPEEAAKCSETQNKL